MVYASDVESITLPGGGAEEAPALVPVADSRGLLLGTALYSPSSQIALRMVSREALDEAAWPSCSMRACGGHRAPQARLDAANDACRLCFSEADESPGLVATSTANWLLCKTKGLLHAVVRGGLRPRAPTRGAASSAWEGLPAPKLHPLACDCSPSFCSFITTPTPEQQARSSAMSAPDLRRARGGAPEAGGVQGPRGPRARFAALLPGGFSHMEVCRRVTEISMSASKVGSGPPTRRGGGLDCRARLVAVGRGHHRPHWP